MMGWVESEGFDKNHRRSRPGFGSSLVLGLGLLLFAPDSTAQEGGGTSSAPDPAETAVEPVAEDEPERGLSFGDVNASAVPNNEKRDRVNAMVVDQREALERVSEILTEARESKDIVQLNCVNEKFTLLKGLLKISEEASVQMFEAIASNAQDLVNHEYTKVVVAHQKSQVLLAEAEQCVGEDSVYAGETLVDVEIDGPGGAGQDPTVNSNPPPPPSVPPVASNF